MSRSTADSPSSVTLPAPGERRRLREALALSEEQVAEAVGVTKATVKAWEAGRSAPRGRKREAYARLLGACGPDGAPPSTSPKPGGRTEARRTEAPGAEARQAEAPRPAAGAEAAPAAKTSEKASKKTSEKASEAAETAVSGAALTPSAPSSPVSSPPPAVPAGDGVSMPAERLKPGAPEPEAAEPAEGPAVPGLTPEEAFDALYAHAAPGLVHQTYLLTGRRALSREAVERAFQQAWQRWPEVAVDADPVGWLRATAYEYALSPWHRLRRAHKHPDAPPAEAGRGERELLSALLELPPAYRRTVLLYDGLGLDLPDTAAETEASTPAAANRLLHARTVLGRRDPDLADTEELHRRLNALVTEVPEAALPAARAVRTGSERRIRAWTRAVVGVTAVLVVMTGVTAVTAPTRYIPVNAPGETVNGVPVRGGPEKLRPEDLKLRDRLRSEPNPGPERLVPVAG
ncbi:MULTISPECIES: helix-turn-helix domain-containing protein [unclassified Streptomyces]|uniref:helix-turn-helix domain-containing protein n=1 Tax=unclassified Streptomyces TaxID=2593676 RepID=UPI0006B062FD|nr:MULTISPECIES: helix-turn-helix domain-containing protein [unclassified Streptomyces]KOX17207.1 XRE family transcriptional regulator [Streptomyces sp. NRRL F-6491]KOX49961.1 XRE family transcriptional regulator [Streptomyces sp. NRRL F-6492]